MILGLRKATQEEIREGYDARMRQEYFHPIERFPERIDQLLDVINRVCLQYSLSSIFILSFLVIFDANRRKSTTREKTDLIFLLR